MTRAKASSSSASVPGHGASHQSAIEAVFDKRTSITQIFAPFILPSMMRCACGLK
jgi:hypothetical protein